MPAPHSTFNQTLSTAVYNYIETGELADNIFNGLRLMSVMYKRGAKRRLDGGTTIVVPIVYAKNTTSRWFGEYDQHTLQQIDFITSAEFLWKMLSGIAIVTDVEVLKNAGHTRQVDLALAKKDNLVESLQDQFDQALFNAGTDTLAPAGLEAIVSTTGTYGGISRATQAFWRSIVTAVGGALTAAVMATMWNDVSANRWRPDIICTTDTQYEKYEGLVTAIQRVIKTNEGADVGFDHLEYKGVPLIWDNYNPSGVMYFLNTQFFFIVCHQDHEFKLSEPIRSPNQKLTIHEIGWFGQFICNNPRTQGKLTGLT